MMATAPRTPQVFTDYTVLTMRKPRHPPTFLALNLEVFKLFAVQSPLASSEVYLIPPAGTKPEGPASGPSSNAQGTDDATSTPRSASSTPRDGRGKKKLPPRLERTASNRSLRRGLSRQGSSRRLLQRSSSSRSLRINAKEGKEGKEGDVVSVPGANAATSGSAAAGDDTDGKVEAKAADTNASPETDTPTVGGSEVVPAKAAGKSKRRRFPKGDGSLLKKFAKAAKKVVTLTKTVAGLPRVDVLEVILVLALFCQGDTSRKLTFMFSVFDSDASGSISKVCDSKMSERINVWCSHNLCVLAVLLLTGARRRCMASLQLCALPVSRSVCWNDTHAQTPFKG